MTHVASTPSTQPGPARAEPAYRARLASCAADLRAAQELRYEVFNIELDEGPAMMR
jgi:putative hemolysin